MTGEEITTVVSIAAGVLIALISLFNSREYGGTVREMQRPVNAALQNSRDEFVQTRQLFETFISNQNERMTEIKNETAALRRLME